MLGHDSTEARQVVMVIVWVKLGVGELPSCIVVVRRRPILVMIMVSMIVRVVDLVSHVAVWCLSQGSVQACLARSIIE